MINNQKVVGVLIIHNDSSLLEQTLLSVKDYIDELVIVDGAYEWVAPFCELNGEDPEKSTDNLIRIVEKSKIPYKYYSGVWGSETHKRKFSIDIVESDYIMLVDSDELFDLKKDEILSFFNSGKIIGECYFPLYFNATVIGESIGLNSAPVKSIFINKKNAENSDIVDSLFLMVPENERKNKLKNNVRYQKKLGTVHHISSFRTDGAGYRRARFYNLLSMRVTGKLNFLANNIFNNDKQFFEMISNLDQNEMESLDNSFKFHRIACSFPNIKDNQRLVESNNLGDFSVIIKESFQEMLLDQYLKLESVFDKPLQFFSGKSIFLDLTEFFNRCDGFKINTPDCKNVEINCYLDFGSYRSPAEVCELVKDSENEYQLNLNQNLPTGARLVIELSPRTSGNIVTLCFSKSKKFSV